MQINRASFLTWKDDTEERALPTVEGDECLFGTLFWEIGDTMAFVVNTDGGIAVGLNPTVSIYPYGGGSAVATFNLSSYNSELWNGFKLYAILVCPNVTSGLYTLTITNSTAIYKSNPVYICTSDFAKKYTAKFKYKHRFNKNNIDYTELELAGFYNEYRLRATFAQTEGRVEKEIIMDSDSATPREYNHAVQQLLKGRLYDLDENMHQAAVDMLSCDELYINGRRYQSQSDYSAGALRRNGTSNGDFTISDTALRHLKRS